MLKLTVRSLRLLLFCFFLHFLNALADMLLPAFFGDFFVANNTNNTHIFYQYSPVGVPRLGVVRVDNRLSDENLKLISISGNTVHFQASFFADKVLITTSDLFFCICIGDMIK